MVCACASLYVHPKANNNWWRDMTSYDWLSKFYSFGMAAIVSIDSRRGLKIEVHYRNQPSKGKLALYKSLLHFYSHLKQLYISNKTERFS